MNHLSEEQLILHYYGEEGDSPEAAQHLEGCDDCRRLYCSLQRVLNVVDALPIPERDAGYGSSVWRRIERELPAGRRASWVPWQLSAPWRWVSASAVVAILVVAAFLAGRAYPPAQQAVPVQLAADPHTGQRVLMVAVGDYLERSQMVLIELANANPKSALDISSEQERAGDLVSETRLYRQTARHTGDAAVAGVLDELERVLLDITHAPSRLSPVELEQLRERLQTEGILFKIRVLGTNVRNHEESAPAGTRAAAGQTL